MKFRVHHILCTQLYRGMGYDGAFCENMTALVGLLRREPDRELTLVCEADAICEKCPNRREDDFCTNGDNHVAEKDRALLEPLGLEEGKRYTYRELVERSRERLMVAEFEKSCQSCEWFGFCRGIVEEEILERRDGK